MSGKVNAFARLGVTLKNARWSWSGKTDDGSQVVLQLWKDHFNYKSRPISYSDFNDPKLPIWAGRPGNKERIENLKWAREHCGGKFRVVIGVSKNIDAETRETIAAYETKMIMRIVEFNEATGELRAEMVDD